VTIDRPAIETAAGRLRPHIRRTPVLDVDGADLGVECDVLALKLEHLQHTGSFKARGALNALLSSTIGNDGVVAASGGNHGVAVAWAASRIGQPANVFVPEIAAPAKVEALHNHGAVVHQVGSEYSAALAAAEEWSVIREVTSVHAYDQTEVVTGAATLAAELDVQRPDLDTIVVACGGGGLAGGLSSWFGSARRIVVVETTGTPTYSSALAAGEPVDVAVSGVGADALGARRLGSVGWAALQNSGAQSVLIDDDAVLDAQAVLWRAARLKVEAAGAAALAALRTGAVTLSPSERVAVVLCGANVA